MWEVISPKFMSSWSCANQWKPPKQEQAESIYSEPARARSQPPPQAFGRYSKAGRGVGELKVKEEWSTYVVFENWWCWETKVELTRSRFFLWLVGAAYLACSRWSWGGDGEIYRSWQSLTKPWPPWANDYRGLASRTGYCRGCGSEFYYHLWPGHCPVVPSVFQNLPLTPPSSWHRMLFSSQLTGLPRSWERH